MTDTLEVIETLKQLAYLLGELEIQPITFITKDNPRKNGEVGYILVIYDPTKDTE